jgi:hypothetical protein
MDKNAYLRVITLCPFEVEFTARQPFCCTSIKGRLFKNMSTFVSYLRTWDFELLP